jgi:small ligand-binding sensory domain FIST
MNNLFTHGHRHLLDAQGSGLSAAWRRAAEDAARHPDSTDDAPAGARAFAPALHRLAIVFAASVLAAALVGALATGRTGNDDEVAAPPAPSLLLAAAG